MIDMSLILLGWWGLITTHFKPQQKNDYPQTVSLVISPIHTQVMQIIAIYASVLLLTFLFLFLYSCNLTVSLSLLLQTPSLSLSLYCSLFSLMHSYLTLLLSCSLFPLSFFVVFSSHSSSPWQNSLHSLCIFASAFSSSMQFNFILPLLFPQLPNLSFHFSPFLPSLISSISFCFSLIIY